MTATIAPPPAANPPRITMPAATQQWLIGYMASQQRQPNPRRIRAGLILRWILWQDGQESMAIPGYASPPADCGTGAPRGWSLKSFRALAAASQETTTARSF